MKIAGYLKTSLLEWPGKISSVVFVPGCNFRCPYCHNSNLVDPKKRAKLPVIPEEKVLADLKKRKKWIDGVVVTGGEPLLQTDLSEFLSRCRQMGFKTMVETNGSKPEVLKLLFAARPRRAEGEAGDSRLLIDFIAMDFKTTSADYEKVVKAKIKNTSKVSADFTLEVDKRKDNLIDKIKKSMYLIIKSGLPFELRTTVVPGIHDEKTLVEMAKQLRKKLQNSPGLAPLAGAGKTPKFQGLKWFLQTFQPKNCLDPKFEKIKPYSRIKMEKFLKMVKKIIPEAELRGF